MWFGQSPSAAPGRGGPVPSIDVADALPDERRALTEWDNPQQEFPQVPARPAALMVPSIRLLASTP